MPLPHSAANVAAAMDRPVRYPPPAALPPAPPRARAAARDGARAWLLLVLGLGLLARLLHIGRQPLWLDEALTLQRIHLDLAGLVADSFASRHMPGYFLLLRLLLPFDADGALLRLPSALFGALSAGVVFAVARRVGGLRAAVVAGLLMALSPLQVQYGQEARSYALVVLLIAVALWGLVRLAQDPRRAARGLADPAADRLGWGAYLFGTVGALDVLGDALPWLAVSALAFWLVWRRLRAEAPPACAGFRRNALFAFAAVLAGCLPLYAAIWLAGGGQLLRHFDWVPPVSPHGVWVAAGSVYLMRMAAVVRLGLLPGSVPLLGWLVLALAVAGMLRLRGRTEGRVLLLAFAVLPLLVLALAPFRSMLVPRYLLWSAAPFLVLAGAGAAALPRRALPFAAAVLLLLGAANLAPLYRQETKPRWDLAAATLAAGVRPGDTVFTADPNAPTMLDVLRPRGAPPLGQVAQVTSRLDEALARGRGGGRVWAVNGRTGLGRRLPPAALEQQLAALGAPAEQIRQGREITILLYAPPGLSD